MGRGMPYSDRTTSIHNLSNISSEELPALPQSFAVWLESLGPEHRKLLGVFGEVDDSKIYPRVALGAYFENQFGLVVARLKQAGVEIARFSDCCISDVRDGGGKILAITQSALRHDLDRLVIATGHSWPPDQSARRGHFASPWPISKLMPASGEFHRFDIGTLGASLSAFDVVSALAHHHGTFEEKNGRLEYRLTPEAEGFRIVMHSLKGLLPHLQFAQTYPMREIYRHVDREGLLALMDHRGFIGLDAYFDKVCRPVLKEAFRKDGQEDVSNMLEDMRFRFTDLIELMTERHEYTDAFTGMAREMEEAIESVRCDRPVHWKESIDDLMYTLNFHAEFLSAEDHLKLVSEVMPFLLNVVAAMPLPSASSIMALHEAGVLDLKSGKVEVPESQPSSDQTRVEITDSGKVETIDYRMFIDCGGQKPVETDEYPFRTMVEQAIITPARARFAGDIDDNDPRLEGISNKIAPTPDGHILEIGGIAVDAAFCPLRADGTPHPHIHEISFPSTLGLRPYSYGLQACDETARLVVESWI